MMLSTSVDSNGVSIQTLAQTVLEICDTSSDIVYEPLPQEDPTERQPDVTKA